MRLISTASVAFLAFAGCATAKPPSELVTARITYARVSQGPVAEIVPEEVHKARVALDEAERSFDAHPESLSTRDLAYIADRTARLAEARGKTARSGKDVAAADHEYKQTLSAQKEQAIAQATQSEDQRNREASQHAAAISDEQARTDAERSARITAETKNQALMSELALFGQLREEARGMVITLSGDVVFVSGQAALLASAQTRLDKLADALRATSHKMVIEGHTDSRGSSSMNQDLSSRRAGAVRDYLVSRGIAADRIQVNGFGKDRPIADNHGPEGRAMNRRVEIIVAGMRMALK